MIVILNKTPPRDPATLTWTDITAVPFLRLDENETDGLHLVFDGDLTADEQWKARVRAECSAVEETVYWRSFALLADLRTIRDTTGDLTITNLSKAARVFARALIALIRLQLRDFDSAD